MQHLNLAKEKRYQAITFEYMLNMLKVALSCTVQAVKEA